MSNEEHYLARLTAVMAIADEQTKSPPMKPGVYFQEAEHLHKWCQEDKEPLVKVGLNWGLVTDLPARLAVAREAQARWYQARYRKSEAETQWHREFEAADALRRELLGYFRFAFRDHPDLLSMVKPIAKRTSRAAIIQDLNTLASLGRNQLPLLENTGFDPGKLADAAAASPLLSSHLAQAQVAWDRRPEVLQIRNKAYTYLKQAMDEIRACGQFAFGKNSPRRKGYISEYHKQNNDKARKPLSPPTPPRENRRPG